MNEITSIGICGVIANGALSAMTGQTVRDEITAWVTLISSIVITLTTIGLQVYRMIRDRNKDKNEETEKQDQEKEIK